MTRYDENLLDNPFFKEFLRQEDLISDILRTRSWTVCVPCIGSYSRRHNFTREELESHIIRRQDEKSEKIFETYNGKCLNVVSSGFVAQGDEEGRVVTILFEETFFIDESKPLNVICVDSRFDSGYVPSNYSFIKCDTVEECSQFLFADNTPAAKGKLDKLIQKSVLSHKSAKLSSLQELSSSTEKTFRRCLAFVERNFHFSRKIIANPNFQAYLELSVEVYMMSHLHTHLFSELCTILAPLDAALNRVLRGLSHIKPSHIDDLSPLYFPSLPLAQSLLVGLNTRQSPRDKGAVFCECLSSLPNAALTGQAMSMDELLPLLNYLVIKSEIPNWLANLSYMQNFMFSTETQDERLGFTLVSFEASIQHIRAGNLDVPYFSQSDNSVTTPWQEISKLVMQNKVGQPTLNVECTLVQDDNDVSSTNNNRPDDSSKCHPLCSCDKCVKHCQHSRQQQTKVDVDCTSSESGVGVVGDNNFTQLMEYLKQNTGVNLNITDSLGRTPLHLACQRSSALGAVDILLSHQVDVNIADNSGRTPLHEACDRGLTDTVTKLLQHKPAINSSSANGDTPLHLAARYGYDDILSLLLDAGASANVRNSKGDTPLSVAHNKHIAHRLQSCSSAVKVAERKKSPVVSTSQQEKLFRICAEGDLQMIKHKLDLNEVKLSSLTRGRLSSVKKRCHPLCECEACSGGVTQSLLSRALLSNADSYTLLHIAALHGHPDLALLFAGHFAWMLDTLTLRDKLSPLHLACQYNNEPIVDILLTAGCDVRCCDAQGNTPLHYSCTNGHDGCALLLLECGSDVTTPNVRGDTPLHAAARWGHISLVNLLLRHDAPTLAQNKDGLIPLHLSQFSEVSEALRRAMGVPSTEPSEDSFADCTSHVSSCDSQGCDSPVTAEEVGSLPDMMSPLSLRTLSLRCGSPSFCDTHEEHCTEDATPTTQHAMPTLCPGDVVSSITEEEVTRAIQDALSESDDEVARSWVLENRPLSFSG